MEHEKLMTPKQLAKELAVPKSWVYRHAAPGCDAAQRLPSVKIGRHLRFSPREIEEWKRANAGRQADAPESRTAPRKPDSATVPAGRSDLSTKTRVPRHGHNGHSKPSVPASEGEI